MGKSTNQQTARHLKKLKRSPKQAKTFSDHIAELRRRLVWIGLFFATGSILAYSYRVPLMNAILSPLHGEKLVYLTPGGGFSFIFQISLYAGLIMAAPIMLYHLHAFIKPALPVRAQHSAGKIVLAAIFLMIGGICYGYFIAVPNALNFLMNFAGDAVTPNLTADSYLSFFLAYTGGLALLALLPLLLVFWHWISPLTPGGLLKSQRWVVVFAFVAAAIVTPTPDVVNQTMIAGPVIGLYQLGVIAVFGAISRSKKANRATQRRKLLLQQAQERHERALRTQAAYLANATSTTDDTPAADSAFLMAADVITATPTTAATTTIDVRQIEGVSTHIHTASNAAAPSQTAASPATQQHRQAHIKPAQERLRYAGVAPVSRRAVAAPKRTTTNDSRALYIPSARQPYPSLGQNGSQEIQPQQA